MERLLTKLAGLQTENDELGVENAALAAALLQDDSVLLLRRMGQGKGNDKGGHGERGYGQEGHGSTDGNARHSHSNSLGHQYQQRQQRDRKVTANATRHQHMTLSMHAATTHPTITFTLSMHAITSCQAHYQHSP